MTVRRMLDESVHLCTKSDTISGFLTADHMASYDTQPSRQMCASWAHAIALCKTQKITYNSRPQTHECIFVMQHVVTHRHSGNSNDI